MLHDIERGIERQELLLGGVELLAADVFGRVDDLALQVAGVHDVEVDQAQGADAGGGQIESQRRTEPAGAHAEHARGLEPLLALHAHLGQDQVPRVAREIVGGQFGKRVRGSRHGHGLNSRVADSVLMPSSFCAEGAVCPGG